MFAVIDPELGRVDVADCFMCSEDVNGEAVFIEEDMPLEVYELAQSIKESMKKMQELIGRS